MKQHKKKDGVRKGQYGSARIKSTKLQRNKQVPVRSDSIGPLLVGVGTEPGDLDVSFIRMPGAVGFRVRLSNLALVVLFVGIVIVCALFQHDRELIRDGFDVFKSLNPLGMHAKAEMPKPKNTDLKAR
jgi:hypothetical protein